MAEKCRISASKIKKLKGPENSGSQINPSVIFIKTMHEDFLRRPV